MGLLAWCFFEFGLDLRQIQVAGGETLVNFQEIDRGLLKSFSGSSFSGPRSKHAEIQ